VGVTPGAESVRTLLDGLCTDLAGVYGCELAPVREDFERARAFREALGWATSERPLLLVIDALDQLGLPPVPLHWPRQTLPPLVHVTVSVLDEVGRPELATLQGRQSAPQVLWLGRMDAPDGDALLGRWLAEAGRTLQTAQRADVLGTFALE